MHIVRSTRDEIETARDRLASWPITGVPFDAGRLGELVDVRVHIEFSSYPYLRFSTVSHYAREIFDSTVGQLSGGMSEVQFTQPAPTARDSIRRPSLGKRLGMAVRSHLVISTLVALVVLSGSAYGVYRVTKASTSNFIDGVASVATIRQSTSLSGTVEPATVSTLTFPIAGTVAAVNVTPGQKVHSGEILASLDTTAAQAQLTQAQFALNTAQTNLANAEATLPLDQQSSSESLSQSQLASAQDQAQVASDKSLLAQDDALVNSFCGGSNASSSECESAQSAATAAQATVAQDSQSIAQDQLSLTATQNKDQQSLDQANEAVASASVSLNSAEAQLAQAESSCSSTSTSSTTSTTSTTTTTTTVPCSTTSQAAAVAQAQQSLANAQTNLSDITTSNQTTLAQAQLVLSQAQAKLASDQASEQLDEAILNGGCPADPSSAECVAAESAVNQATSSLSSAQSALATASQGVSSTQTKNTQSLLGAQSQVDLDRLQVTADQATVQSDQAALAENEIVAPSNGTVLTNGFSVGASTGGNSITFKATSAWVVDVTVSDAQIGLLAVGQQATITPSTSSTPLFGSLTSITQVATVTSGVATFPAVVSITPNQVSASGKVSPVRGLFAGVTANVTVVTKTVPNALTVPTSAIHTIGARSFVFVPSGKGEKRVVVTLGASGGGLTQVTSGLKAGQSVVIANRSAALPTLATGTRAFGKRAFGGGGGLGGGAFGGGGGLGGGGFGG